MLNISQELETNQKNFRLKKFSPSEKEKYVLLTFGLVTGKLNKHATGPSIKVLM